MRVWIDTEFIDQGYNIDVSSHLISIGLVREDGKELYLENAGSNWGIINKDPWLRANVLTKLTADPKRMLWAPEIAAEILEFCSDIRPEFWAYFASYDWMLLCKLYEAMMKVPKGWPKYCRDVRQLMWHMQIDSSILPKQDKETQHHALEDARWLKKAHEWIDLHFKLVPHQLRELR